MRKSYFCSGSQHSYILPHMTRAIRSRLVIFLLLPLLLLAQGVRVCLHDFSNLAHGTGHQHSSPLHLESTLSALADHEEAPGDVDVPFSALTKLHVAALAFALVTTFVFILLALPRRGLGFPLGHSRPFYFPHLHYLSPPLRAPPRFS